MRGIRTALLLLAAFSLAGTSGWAAPRKAKPPISLERQPVQPDSDEAETPEPADAAPTPATSPAKPSQASPAATTDVSTAGMPPGASLTRGYVTQIKGDGVVAQDRTPGQPVRSGPAPDIVVQAVPVDADGNPLSPEPTPAFGPSPAQPETALNEADSTPAESPQEDEKASDEGGFFSFLFGSDDDEEEQKEEAAQEETIPVPDLSPASRNMRIGELVTIDNDRSLGVVWLESRYLAFYGRELVLSRADDLSVTGVLQLTTLRNGKAVGLKRLTGTPRRGDEIILPGPQYTDYINELYDTGQIAHTRDDLDADNAE
ncbi:hypothetical protein [Ruficoccus sp. ZRK36]|uniref:hypothetical protein n=1 Tax=Ruficoccus sp. ZRK36 TaxID=2866311 RepID=UPI001C72D5F9|nr:hypothetical protein [Ruficoccus sp. ZRK36]QYY35585.1 hypothetical protein K0V07_14960 [Ruficoccus sp. ZRK36]